MTYVLLALGGTALVILAIALQRCREQNARLRDDLAVLIEENWNLLPEEEKSKARERLRGFRERWLGDTGRTELPPQIDPDTVLRRK